MFLFASFPQLARGRRKFFSVKVAGDFSEDGSLCGFGFFC